MRYKKDWKRDGISGSTGKGGKTGLHPLPFVIGGAVVLIGVPLVLILLIHLPFVQKEIIDKVVGEIGSATAVSIQLESYRWWPFSRLSVSDLRVKSAGKEVLECGEARLLYRLSSKWPYFVPSELSLENPVLRLEKDSKGQWRFPSPTLPHQEGAAQQEQQEQQEPREQREQRDVSRWLSFPWPPVRIKSGVITAEQDGGTILNIRDVSGTLSFQSVTGPNGPSLKVKLGDWGGRAELPRLGIWSISGDLSISPEMISVESLAAAVGEDGARFACQGEWGLEQPYDGEVKAELVSVRPAAFPELAVHLPQLQEASGVIELKREAGAFTVVHEVRTNLGSFKGRLNAVQAPSGVGGSAQWTMELSDFKASEVLAVPDSLFSGQVELSVAGDSPRTMKASLDGRLGPSRSGEATFKAGDIKASYENGHLTIGAVRIESSAGAFSLSGSADLEGLWNEKHSGEVSADFKVEAASLDKVLSAKVGGVGGAARLKARYGPGEIKQWEKWQAEVESKFTIPEMLSLKASAAYKGSVLDLQYDLDAGDLSRITQVLPLWQGKGRLASKGKIKGSWPELVWEGTINSPGLEYGSVRSEQASLTGKGMMLGTNGDRKLVFKTQGLDVDGRKLGSFQLEVEQHEDGCRFKVRGEQPWNRITAAISGRIDNLFAYPRQIAISDGKISWNEQAGSVDGRIEVQQDRVRVHSLGLRQGGQKVRVAGVIARDGDSDLKVSLEGLKAGQWLGLVGLENAVTGTVSGEAQLAGRASQPEINLSVQLSDGGLQVKQKRDIKGQKKVVTIKEPLGTVRLKGRYAGDALSIQGELQNRAEEKPIQFTARVPLRLSLSPLRLAVSKSVDWSSSWKLTGVRGEDIQPYIPVITSAGGRFFAEGRGSGTLGQPVLRTDGTWKDGSFVPTAWPHPVENAQVEWWADAMNIYVTKSDMKHLGGHVSITGKIDYPHFDVMEWEAVGEDLEVPEIYGIEGKVGCNVRLVQDLEKADLSGELRFSKATLNLGEFQSDLERNIVIVEGDSKGNVVVISGDEKQQRSYYNRLKMALAIKLPASGTWVRGKGLEAEITGDLRMEKEPYDPLRFVGGFQTVRGTYTFQGNELDIVDGEIMFSGRPHADPNLRIMCRKEVRDVSIQVQVTGPLSRPKMVLSSIPAMNQVDVLSYLLFGHPATELGAKESNQLQSGAAAWLGSQTSSVIKGMFGDSRFAPDSLTYRSPTTTRKEATTATNTEGGIIEIGKHITPNLEVTYGQGVMGQTEKQVQLEYRINRHLSVQTQVGSEEQSGVDVFWRYDFGK